jgi:hypothetical protein
MIRHIDELDAGAKLEIGSTLRLFYRGISPVSRLWYETMKPFLNPNAAVYVERVLAQGA